MLTSDTAIDVLTGITIARITSAICHLPTEVMLTPTEDEISAESAVNLDDLQTVPKAKLGGLITILSPNKVEAVEHAICFALGIDHLL